MRKVYLPIGSVVSLKGIEKRVMIYGIAQEVIQKEESKIYDYLACIFPEGHVGEEKILFNQEDISAVFFIGFQDSEQLLYRAGLDEKLAEMIGHHESEE